MNKCMRRYLLIELAIVAGMLTAFLADVRLEVMILPILAILWMVLMNKRRRAGERP